MSLTKEQNRLLDKKIGYPVKIEDAVPAVAFENGFHHGVELTEKRFKRKIRKFLGLKWEYLLALVPDVLTLSEAVEIDKNINKLSEGELMKDV